MKTIFYSCLILFTSIYTNAQTNLPLETVLQKGHSEYIRAYDFSADNAYVISGGFDNVLLLWDIQNGKQIRTFSGHTARIKSIEISPDQKFVLSVSADNTAKVFEIETGKLIWSFKNNKHDILSGYYGPNSKYVYILSNRDEVYVWNVKTGNEVAIYKKDYAASNERFLIDASQEKILSANGSKGIVVISLTSQDTLLSIPFDKVYSQSFSPDGSQIAISSSKLFAAVYNSETGQLINEFRDGKERCDGCNTKHAFSPDGKYLLTMSNKVGATLWNISSGKKIRTFLTSDKRPNGLKFSSKGTYILISFGDYVHVFDTKSGKEKFKIKNRNFEYYDFKFSKNEQFIVLPNSNGGLDLWDVNKGSLKKTISGYLNIENTNGFGLSYSNWRDQTILNAIQHKQKVLLSPDNKLALIAGIDSVAMLIDLKSGRIVKTFKGHSKTIIAFDFSPSGEYIATGGGDRLIKIWEASTGKLIKTLKGHQETIFDLKFNASGEQIISSAWDGSIRIWDWKENKQEYISMNKNSAYCVGFTPNELYLVTTDLSKNVQFWERDAAEPFRTLIGHTSVTSEFDFSPDAQNMVTSSWDGNVKLWNVLTGMLIGRMNQHQGQVYAVKYDPENRFIASAGGDGKIIIWDHKSNKILANLVGHSTAVTSIDISSDGKFLISISIDGLIKMWDLTTYKEMYSRIQMSRNEWLATNPSGYFDGSSNALEWVNYVKGNQVVNVSKLFEKYYTPDLIERINKKEIKLNDRSESINVNMTNLPDLTVSIGESGKRSVVQNKDSVFSSKTDKIALEIGIADHKIALDEIRIYNNGKLILQESLEENISFRGGDKKHLFEIPLSNGINELKTVVVNNERTESEPNTILVSYDGGKQKTDLFIISIGINNYKNPAYSLDYAVNDSKAFVKTIKKGADSLFNSVITYSILNAKATKENILATITEIEAEIGSEDVFIFYYAGHGIMSGEIKEKPEFFIVTHDVTNLYDSHDKIREKAISAAELMEIAVNISAEKQLFVLDACHSGGAIESFAVRGNEREKALAQLARNTGTFFLTAAQDAEYANEVGKLNHGLFTYALLELLQGTVTLDGDNKITVSELKSYVEERVPELSEEHHGSPQYPTGYSFGRDFPIVILK